MTEIRCGNCQYWKEQGYQCPFRKGVYKEDTHMDCTIFDPIEGSTPRYCYYCDTIRGTAEIMVYQQAGKYWHSQSGCSFDTKTEAVKDAEKWLLGDMEDD